MEPQIQTRGWTKTIGKAGLWATLAAAVVTTLCACNTTEGVGKDVESAGRGVKEAAQDAKN